MYLPFHFFFFLVLTTKCAIQEKIYGPFQLKSPTFSENLVEMKEVTLTFEEYPNSIRGIVASRFRYTSLCYTDFFGGSECSSNIIPDFPSFSEALEWSRSMSCMVGKVCIPNGDCWGNGAKVCSEKNPVKNVKGRSKFMYATPPIPFSLYHTCTQDWICDVHVSDYPTHLVSTNNGTALCTSDNNGLDIMINTDVLTNGFIKKNEYILFLIPQDLDPRVTSVKGKCTSRSPSEIICLANLPGVDSSIVFDVNPNTFEGISRNRKVRIVEPILSVRNGSVVQLTPSNNSSGKTQIVDVEKAANIEDALEQLNILKASQMQNLYNEVQLKRDIYSLRKMITTIVESVSKVNHKIIPRISGYSGSTYWVNNDIFYIKSEEMNEVPLFSNCYGNKVYKGGVMVEKTKDDLCFSVTEEEVHDMELFNDNPLSENFVTMLDPEAAAMNWDGWSWMMDSSNKIDEIRETIGGDIDDKLGSITSYLPWTFSSIYQYFLGISSFIAYLSLLLHFLKR